MANLSKAFDACLNAFGREVEYRPQAGDPFTVKGVFVAAHSMVDVDSEVPISSTSPVLDVQYSDFTTLPKKGDEVLINGQLYRVVDRHPHSNGNGAKLELHKK